MYPFTSDVFAARNHWYVAAFSNEVSRQPFERWILDEPVVLYRKEDGAPVAVEGRCPHRHYPLGEGQLRGDNIECPYHGLTFAPDGRCVRAPSQARAPSNCSIRSYPVIEKWSWIWIWTGDLDRMDSSLIPDHTLIGLDAPGFVTAQVGHNEVAARYQLVHDNLSDLTHIAFLHANTIGAGSEAAAVPSQKQSEGPNWIKTERVYRSGPVPHIFAEELGRHGLCDRYIPFFFFMPALHVGMDDFRYPSDDPEKLGESFGKLLVYHAITPARRTTTHYFFAATARNFGLEANEKMVKAFGSVIGEDLRGLKSVERMISEFGDSLPPDFSVRADNQQLLARRKLEALVVADRTSSENLAPPEFHFLEAEGVD